MTTGPTLRSHTTPFVTRVRVENDKFIAHCDVPLGLLTGLAGYNAAGKSNFLDALRFVRDAVDSGPRDAVAPWLTPTHPPSTSSAETSPNF
ncbi:AAA family ATPase [Streptomyces sp. SYSU K21746]